MNGINIVSLDWLLDSDQSNNRESEAKYSLSSPSSTTAPATSTGTRRSARQKDSQSNEDNKRALDADDASDNAGKPVKKTAKKTDEPPAKKRKDNAGKADPKTDPKVDQKAGDNSDAEDEDEDEGMSDSKSDAADSQPRALKVPVDSCCPMSCTFSLPYIPMTKGVLADTLSCQIPMTCISMMTRSFTTRPLTKPILVAITTNFTSYNYSRRKSLLRTLRFGITGAELVK